jgi:iron complex transport system permease protein
MRRHLVLRLAGGSVSVRTELGTLIVLLGSTGIVLGALALGILLGDYPLTPAEVASALVGNGSDAADFIVLTLRLPRLLTAVLVGAALGVSGALFQSIARNPLAAPDIIGVMAGASVAAVSLIVFGGPAELLGLAALLGGLAAAGLLVALAWDGGMSRLRLVLVGIGLNAAALAMVDYLLTRGRIEEVQQATIWLLGSLHGSSWSDVWLLAPALLALGLAAAVLARHLEAIRLGDEVAIALGASADRHRLLLIGIAVGFAAAAVTVAGPVAFVAFIAPHLARRLSRAAGSGVLATSAVIGGALVVAADLVARRVVAPTELPVGIFTVLIGAPYFIWLLYRRGRVGTAA